MVTREFGHVATPRIVRCLIAVTMRNGAWHARSAMVSEASVLTAIVKLDATYRAWH